MIEVNCDCCGKNFIVSMSVYKDAHSTIYMDGIPYETVKEKPLICPDCQGAVPEGAE